MSMAPSDCARLRGLCNRTSVTASASNQHGVALPPTSSLRKNGTARIFVTGRRQSMSSMSPRSRSLVVRAAKLPLGVEAPLEEPNLPVSLWGFTEKAEAWNSRAAMIGLFGLIALEFFAQRGVLQLIGVDVGKGLDLPL